MLCSLICVCFLNGWCFCLNSEVNSFYKHGVLLSRGSLEANLKTIGFVGCRLYIFSNCIWDTVTETVYSGMLNYFMLIPGVLIALMSFRGCELSVLIIPFTLAMRLHMSLKLLKEQLDLHFFPFLWSCWMFKCPKITGSSKTGNATRAGFCLIKANTNSWSWIAHS